MQFFVNLPLTRPNACLALVQLAAGSWQLPGAEGAGRVRWGTRDIALFALTLLRLDSLLYSCTDRLLYFIGVDGMSHRTALSGHGREEGPSRTLGAASGSLPHTCQ